MTTTNYIRILSSIITLLTFSIIPNQAKATEAINTNIDGEKILSYDEYIKVRKNRSLDITETIKIYVTNSNIKHGINRDIPTIYTGTLGLHDIVVLDKVQVLRDHNSEKYTIINQINGKRIRIGDPNYILKTGVHTYTIKYRLTEQIRIFEDHDEVYHNVTGNGWVFPIDKVNAVVELPEGIKPEDIKINGFTGEQESKDKNFTAKIEKSDNKTKVIFTTTKPLNKYEGLTVAIAFPKGYVNEQTAYEQISNLILANIGLMSSFIIFIIISIYLYITWIHVGKDPEGRTIIPEYEVTKNMSPAAIRFIHKMDFDDKLLTASLVDLAIKKIIKITSKHIRYVGDDVYTIELLKDIKSIINLPEEEQILVDEFFKTSNTFSFTQSKALEISRIKNTFYKLLQKLYYKKYFSNNYEHLILPAILILLNMVVVGIHGYYIGDTEAIKAIIVFLFWGIGVLILAIQLFPIIKQRNLKSIFPTIILIIFITPLITMLIDSVLTSGFSIIFILASISITGFASNFLKARTIEGRKIEDKSLGLKLFLETVEKHRYRSKLHKDIPTSLKVYEEYLPYAIALDIEPIWTDKFQNELSQIKENDTQYQNITAINYATFGNVSSFGESFTQSIVSSSMSPSSGGSGFSSGGSSGGGGGGGGGSGW